MDTTTATTTTATWRNCWICCCFWNIATQLHSLN